MMELTSVIAAVLLALQAQPVPTDSTEETAEAAPASTDQSANAETAEAEADQGEKVICKRTAVVGSKFKKKVCGTKKQWEMMANSSSRAARDIQRRNRSTGGPQ
ncbi:MAG: hypothetical protein AAF250_04680 [Pseudomonadota bacterium]